MVLKGQHFSLHRDPGVHAAAQDGEKGRWAYFPAWEVSGTIVGVVCGYLGRCLHGV